MLSAVYPPYSRPAPAEAEPPASAPQFRSYAVTFPPRQNLTVDDFFYRRHQRDLDMAARRAANTY